MEKTLLFGAGGFLAREIMKRDHEIIGIPEEDCDITEKKKVFEIIDIHKPNVVLNCAAITDLSYCEKNPLKAWEVNVRGVRNISEAARNNKSFMVHFSSDYALNPVNEYGWTKLASENLVNGLVLRANLYNELHWLFKVLENGEKVKLLKNIRFNPVTVRTLLYYMEKLVQKRYFGLVNVGVKDELSYFDFGIAMCEVFGFEKKLIKPVSSIDVGYNYPKDSYLELSTLKKLGLKIFSVKEDMRLLKNEIKR